MKYVTGQIYDGESFFEGHIGFEDGIIRETGKVLKRDAVAKGVIVPTFVNVHTHIGDSIIQEELKGDLLELIAPPDGLKHRVLRSTPRHKLIECMRSTADRMLSSAIEHFCDFREGGLDGIGMINEALKASPLKPKIFGRPRTLEYDEEELGLLLESSDGIGLSSLSDWDRDHISEIALRTHSADRGFALHASERVREDIDAILDLHPDFLVHMTEASDGDLEICAEQGVPIVVCPRSEVFFGHMPNIPLMLEKGVELSLATDNAMINPPYSLLREMEFAYKISRYKGDLSGKEILRMVLQNPRKVLNVGDDIRLTSGRPANFVVFDIPRKDPANALFNYADIHDITLISINKYLWSRDLPG